MSFLEIKNASNIKRNTISINSAERTTGTRNDFTYDLPTPITDVRLITLNSVEFPQTIYNIREINNSFTFISPLGVTHSISLTPSTYDLPRLLETLVDKIEAVADGGVDIEIFFDDYEYFTFVSVGGVTSFGLDFGITNSIGSVLGISEQSFFGITTLTSVEPINLITDKNLYICSSALTTNTYDTTTTSSGISNVLTKVQLNENFGGLISINREVNIRNKIASLSSIDISLRDKQNNIIEIQNDNITLTFDIYSRVFNNPFTV